MFYLQDPSLLEFQRRFQDSIQRNNLSTVFGVKDIPDDSQLREIIDGTEYFGSEKIGCMKCLRKKSRYGEVRYSHQILQATVMAPGKRQVIPLGPEFISNKSMGGVQDCELEAGKRLIPKLRSAHRQLSMVIVGDSLYSKQPFIKVLKEQKMHFILGAKPKDHKSLMEDIEFQIYNTEGKRTYHNSWVTDLEVNVRDLVKGGRARWKIENEGFNTLKNHGYHLEHNFGHGTKNLSEAFFMLNLLSFFVHQILELTDLLYQSCRAGFSARKEFWNVIRASFRLLLFDSWAQVLIRMNSPPLPAFQG